MESVTVEAPASSANLGPGFDVFALALDEPRDRLEIETGSGGDGRVEVMVEGDKGITTDPRRNAAGAVVLSIMKRFRLKGRIAVRLTKGVPVGIGLGSSGASSAAAAFAMDRAFSLGMMVTELILHAGEGERAVSGAAHLDNATASLLGGFVLVRGPSLIPVQFRPPESLALAVVTPKVRLPERKTEFARSLVPKSTLTRNLVKNVSMASTIVAGFAKEDIQMIGEGMEDAVVEIARARMIPGFGSVKKAAKETGAAGVCISGAGPSVLSLIDKRRSKPRSVLAAMIKAFKSNGVRADGFVTMVGEGARLIESP